MTDPIFGSPEPVRPYAGSSGWSGSEGSRQRALAQDASGATGHRQQMITGLIAKSGPLGMTVEELRDPALGIGHHGEVSGALSVLHKAGAIVSLEIQRGRCHIYVSPENVHGRAVRPFRGKSKTHQAPAERAAAYAEMAKDHEPARPKPSLTDDERRLIASATLNVRRFSGAQVMPVKPTSMKALLALIERITK